jgi:imidazolonepropionase-like amidohydrolase
MTTMLRRPAHSAFARLLTAATLILAAGAHAVHAQPTPTAQPAAPTTPAAATPIVVQAKLLRTMGPAGDITSGLLLIENGKVAAIGTAATMTVPAGAKVITTQVAVPGLIDGRSTVGLSGLLNTKHDSDQLERSAPVQPELRAIDAFNPQDPLVAYVRSLGVTTIHTGHAPGELISGQTLIAKTTGGTVQDCTIVPVAMVAATLGPSTHRPGAQAPGTRAKAVAMLRAELIRAQEYRTKLLRPAPEAKPAADATTTDGQDKPAGGKPARDLRLETLVDVLDRKVPLLITAQSSQDITSALRLAEEFKFRLILDGGAEAYLLTAELKAAGVPVILHPPMARAYGELANSTLEAAALLRKAGIPFCFQAGYEAYVPKTRVVLFEAAIAAANGLGQDAALRAITIDAATLLGIADRVGSLEPGKDADVACYDGDPLEYTTHCTAVIIGGKLMTEPAAKPK